MQASDVIPAVTGTLQQRACSVDAEVVGRQVVTLAPEFQRGRNKAVRRRGQAVEDIVDNELLRDGVRDRLTEGYIVKRRIAHVEGEVVHTDADCREQIEVFVFRNDILQHARITRPFPEEVHFAGLNLTQRRFLVGQDVHQPGINLGTRPMVVESLQQDEFIHIKGHILEGAGADRDLFLNRIGIRVIPLQQVVDDRFPHVLREQFSLASELVSKAADGVCSV